MPLTLNVKELCQRNISGTLRFSIKFTRPQLLELLDQERLAFDIQIEDGKVSQITTEPARTFEDDMEELEMILAPKEPDGKSWKGIGVEI